MTKIQTPRHPRGASIEVTVVDPVAGPNGITLDQLSARLHEATPPSLNGWLVTPSDEKLYHHGTVVPILALPLKRRASGLFVVGSHDDPQPIDQVSVYLTASELFGQPLSEEVLDQVLADVSGEALVLACAWMLHANSDQAHRSDREGALLRAVLPEQLANRAQNQMAQDGRQLIVPQLTLLTAAFGVLARPWRIEGSGSDRLQPAVSAAFLLALQLGDIVEGAVQGDSESVAFGNVGEGLAQELIANQLFNSSTDIRSALARHEQLWHEVLPRLVKEEGVVDLREAFQTATGVAIEVFEAIGLGLYASVSAHGPLVAASYFSSSKLDASEVDRALNIIAVTPERLGTELDTALEGSLRDGRWELGPFSRWPVIRTDNEKWIVLSQGLLVDRIFSGLAFFDALGDEASNGGSARRAWGCATEEYGRVVLRGIASADRIFDEDALRNTYSRRGQKIADAAVEYPGHWIVLDFSSRRPSQDFARARGFVHVRSEVERLVLAKAEQLEATIDAIRKDESRLTRREGYLGRRFTPVIVVHSLWPTNPVMHEIVQLELQKQGLLQASDVEALEVLTIEEFEMVEALQEVGGPDLHTLLRRKRDGPLAGMGLKDHILLVERLEVPQSTRVSQMVERLWERVLSTLDFESVATQE